MGAGRFLVLEDEATVVSGLARLIRPFGDAFPALTIRQADSLLAEGIPWTALILDCRLPDGSGLDVLARARTWYPVVPAMVLTGHNDDVVANAAYDLNADYVVKPVKGERLVRFLTRASSARAERTLAERIERVVAEVARCQGLSVAEADVLLRAARGESRDEIAAARATSPWTIKNQIASLLRKTGDDSLHAAAERVLRDAALL
jgi:DNA-binding NarL/FixJ family response regulator